MKVEAVIPAFFSRADGTCALTTRNSRWVRVLPEKSVRVCWSGREFRPAELADAGRTAIVIRALADGIVVGGLTYVLDPTLGEPDDAKKCCEPCIDDRCKKPCPCPPCEEPNKSECPPEPCAERNICCDEGVRRVCVQVDLEPCEPKTQKCGAVEISSRPDQGRSPRTHPPSRYRTKRSAAPIGTDPPAAVGPGGARRGQET